jgi:hypothetical protein
MIPGDILTSVPLYEHFHRSDYVPGNLLLLSFEQSKKKRGKIKFSRMKE